ncbi:MAG TPA: ComF family protein [Pyrinomonadaceae bacterium]|nr:ComF family protein [Pyrinomonadaceae bacterium]
MSTTISLYDATLALIYPQECAVCGESVDERACGVACAECWRETRVFDGSEIVCWKCGALAEGTVPEEDRALVRCRRCEAEAFTAARACGTYEGALRASVLALKREPYVASHLSRLMLEAQQRAPLNHATCILPVPLHTERARERGFNQASILAQELARRASLPFDQWSLSRITHTERHRAGMDARARRESVLGAFKVTRPRLIQDQRILLVDDVFTTGATVSACAQALKAAGAQEVFILTVARPMY